MSLFTHLQEFVNKLGTSIDSSKQEPKQEPKHQPLPQKPVALTEYIALTPSHNAKFMAETATEFMTALSALTIKVKSSNLQLRRDEIDLTHEFFFVDVFGKGSRQRLHSLQTYMLSASAGDLKLESGQLALKLSQDLTIECNLREFFRSYNIWHRGTVSTMTTYYHIIHISDGNRLYQQYSQLAEAGFNDASRQYLAERGFKASRGRGYRSVLTEYFSQQLNMKARTLKNILQKNKSIHALVKAFGPGNLGIASTGRFEEVFTQPSKSLARLTLFAHRFTRFGNAKMAEVIKILSGILNPWAREICDLANQNVLKPILAGQPLPTLLCANMTKTNREKLSLLETFTTVPEETDLEDVDKEEIDDDAHTTFSDDDSWLEELREHVDGSPEDGDYFDDAI